MTRRNAISLCFSLCKLNQSMRLSEEREIERRERDKEEKTEKMEFSMFWHAVNIALFQAQILSGTFSLSCNFHSAPHIITSMLFQ